MIFSCVKKVNHYSINFKPNKLNHYEKFQKVVVTVLAVSFLVLFSCKKDKTDVTKDTVFTFTAGSTKYDLSADAYGYANEGTSTVFIIMASNTHDTISVDLDLPSLTVGKYTLTSNPTNGSIYFMAGKNSYNSSYGTSATYTIEITSNSDTYVEGTFSGKLGTFYTEWGTESKYVDITNGKFIVPKIGK